MHNSFSQPDNLLHKIDTYTSQGGEIMGQPSFSQPPKKQRLHVYHDRVRLAVFSQTINHLHNSFPPPDYLLNKVDV